MSAGTAADGRLFQKGKATGGTADGFEPETRPGVWCYHCEVCRSYGTCLFSVDPAGFEPTTPWLKARCSAC